jgi:AcrR family transcriptional regulator
VKGATADAELDLREEQKAATRARIVRAVSDLVAEEHPAAISVPAVARRAGVGVATVYRYFPSKEELLDAAASGAVTPEAGRLPTSFDELGPTLHAAWNELADQLPLVRNQFASPVGRDLHRRRWEAKHELMASLLEADGIDPESDAGRRLLGMADVVTSSTALLELHDKAGTSVDDAAAWCAWAVDVLYRATQEARP